MSKGKISISAFGYHCTHYTHVLDTRRCQIYDLRSMDRRGFSLLVGCNGVFWRFAFARDTHKSNGNTAWCARDRRKRVHRYHHSCRRRPAKYVACVGRQRVVRHVCRPSQWHTLARPCVIIACAFPPPWRNVVTAARAPRNRPISRQVFVCAPASTTLSRPSSFQRPLPSDPVL